MPEQPNTSVMKAVAIMTDWRIVRTFSCEAVFHNSSDGSEQVFDLHAEPMHSSYSLTDRATGRVQSYDDATRTIMTEGHAMQRQLNHLLIEAVPVRLAFPLSLPVWGRRHDRYRMVGAHQEGSLLTVQLADKESDEPSGTLVIDVDRGAAVRIDAPILRLEYRDIVPAKTRFGLYRD